MAYETFDSVMRIARIVVVSTGLIGNLISFIIFSKKTFLNNSISTYCRALAVVQCITLIGLINDVHYLVNGYYLMISSDGMCKAIMYLTNEYSAIPGWILVLFSIDKMINMRTKKLPILKKKWFQWSIVAGVILINALIYLEIPILLQLKTYSTFYNILLCDISTLSFFNPLLIGILLEANIIPFVIMMFTSIVSIRLLIRSRNSLERVGNVDRHRRSRDNKYAVSSIAFNIVFVGLKLPLTIFYILYANNISVSYYYLQISLLLYTFDCSSSVFVHLATNSLYRSELLVLLRLRSEQNAQSTVSNMNSSIQLVGSIKVYPSIE